MQHGQNAQVVIQMVANIIIRINMVDQKRRVIIHIATRVLGIIRLRVHQMRRVVIIPVINIQEIVIMVKRVRPAANVQ